jgi:peptidoglycan/xylan/chitin deacetylase (PgdA/CDA1 family)
LTARLPAYWAVRQHISPHARIRVRRWVDRAGGSVLGSINGAASAGHVAITLDDGPDELVTPQLLDVLTAHGATATFFVLVGQGRQYPELLRRVAREGHEIALHGFDHRRITRCSHSEAVAYLRSAKAELEELAGVPVRFYRPPFGSQSLSSLVAARRAGLTVVAWSCDGDDWVDRPVADVARLSLARLDAGGVLLLHERLEPDPERDAPVTTFDRAELMGTVLEAVAERGWRAVTVGQLIEEAPARRTVWLRP